jgi:hypothetical protein
MKVAFLSLLTFVSVALAVPPHDPQFVFDVTQQDIQNIREGVNSLFDKPEDKVKQWVQDGRDFISHNDLTCQSILCKILSHRLMEAEHHQMNLSPIPHIPHIGFV